MSILRKGDKVGNKKQAMGNIFGQTKINVRKAEQIINDKKIADFLPIAVRGKDGGWIRFKKDKKFINIPDIDEKGITQIAVNGPRTSENRKNTEYAVFVEKGIKQGTTGAQYEFFGICSRTVSKEDRYSTYFKLLKTEFETDDWKE
ncbi:MAG: hypothetical protein LBB89_13605 [Treponema sp.]|jgi:hypothetical protein|nr:hypothetical protein [Treponema sp.]